MRFVFLALSIVLLLPSQMVMAQKFGYVDSKFILSKMPEYKEAQQEIEDLSDAWQQEIQSMRKEIESMYAELKAEEVLLTKELKEQRLKEIQKKESEVKAYQKKVFGFDGLFFLKKKELVKPVQDKVFEAVEIVAKKERLQIVFDKAGELIMIYTDPIHDYTDIVLEELGLIDDNDLNKN
ncbi:OmpH family outer membrane protein [Marivirga atlantica]|jgi:outer membrane protein|uniref:OmpH family outer membrane protein n=1 Tax=Marivirga atlantica TaxID=1548457 RepID=A0A937DII0_9BACT|nr:OmpH family outer membrane protein [Marivirga atlantica]MBL0763804.1 OmpH family outer membrane protein [Marivirga atlantica]